MKFAITLPNMPTVMAGVMSVFQPFADAMPAAAAAPTMAAAEPMIDIGQVELEELRDEQHHHEMHAEHERAVDEQDRRGLEERDRIGAGADHGEEHVHAEHAEREIAFEPRELLRGRCSRATTVMIVMTNRL